MAGLAGSGNMLKSVYDPDEDGKIEPDEILGFEHSGPNVGYVNIADKVVNTDTGMVDTNSSTYVNAGTAYTITEADMDYKTASIKVALSADLLNTGGDTSTVGYNKNAGADIDIGTETGATMVSKTIADIELVVGDIIQFRHKCVSQHSQCESRIVTQTHAGVKNLNAIG